MFPFTPLKHPRLDGSSAFPPRTLTGFETFGFFTLSLRGAFLKNSKEQSKLGEFLLSQYSFLRYAGAGFECGGFECGGGKHFDQSVDSLRHMPLSSVYGCKFPASYESKKAGLSMQRIIQMMVAVRYG